MSRTKSVSKNAMLSSLNTFTDIMFSLITFPYVSRILSVDGIGAINFGNSIVGYLSLIAALGIGNFAVRNGSQLKRNKSELEKFGSEVFSINIISTVVSILIMLILIMMPTKLHYYATIIIIQSLSLVTSPMTLNWLYSIFEDFEYITIRNILIKVTLFIAVLLFVRDESDTIIYVLICGAGTATANLVNFLYSRKYIKLKFTFKTNWKVYKSNIWVFFINSLATTVYLNLDTTMLGFMTDDTVVGLYAVATKIYGCLKQVIHAGITATLPRLAFYAMDSQGEFKKLVEKMINIIILISLPLTSGLFILNKNVILIISGEKYINSTTSLLILSIAIVLTMLANVFTYGVLMSYKKEKIVMYATIVSAVVNVVLNFILIPFINEIGAAITTVLAEIIVLSIAMYFSRDYVKGIRFLGSLRNAVIGCSVMFGASHFIKLWLKLDNTNCFISSAILVSMNIIVYYVVLKMLHDPYIGEFISSLKKKIRIS